MSTRDSDLLTCSFMSVSNWIHLLTHAMLMSLLFFFFFNTVVRQTETGLCVYCLMLNQPTLSDLSPEFSRVLLVQTAL